MGLPVVWGLWDSMAFERKRGVNPFQRIAPKPEVCEVKGKLVFVKLGLYEL